MNSDLDLVTNLNNGSTTRMTWAKKLSMLFDFPIQTTEEFQHLGWLAILILIDIYIILFTPIVQVFGTKYYIFTFHHIWNAVNGV